MEVSAHGFDAAARKFMLCLFILSLNIHISCFRPSFHSLSPVCVKQSSFQAYVNLHCLCFNVRVAYSWETDKFVSAAVG